jgi:hypothetical protein
MSFILEHKLRLMNNLVNYFELNIVRNELHELD